MPFPRTSPRMHMLSISTTSVVKRQEDEWRGELRARETSTKAPDTPRGPLRTRNAPDRTCIMTATQKYRTSPLPAAIPGGFARSPASSRMATVRFAHPLAMVAAAFQTPGNHDPSPSGWPGLSVFSPGSANPTTPNLRQPPAADQASPPQASSMPGRPSRARHSYRTGRYAAAKPPLIPPSRKHRASIRTLTP